MLGQIGRNGVVVQLRAVSVNSAATDIVTAPPNVAAVEMDFGIFYKLAFLCQFPFFLEKIQLFSKMSKSHWRAEKEVWWTTPLLSSHVVQLEPLWRV